MRIMKDSCVADIPAWLAARGLDPAPYEAALSSFLATGKPLRLDVDDVSNPRSVRSPAAS
ncbi:hypothetical protein XH87_27390 [Bradyrhizobium sp. CCBAU 53415]|nr:hypothetical protein [Bradyrhizobium sp. CCBAU 53380]MDA9468259.1 hypothetical protein [Bradyrhizobium sp. CCBAU 53415]